jgi:hypothetical protein
MSTFAQRAVTFISDVICELRARRANGYSSAVENDDLEEFEKMAGHEAPARTTACGSCPGCSLVTTAPDGATLH